MQNAEGLHAATVSLPLSIGFARDRRDRMAMKLFADRIINSAAEQLIDEELMPSCLVAADSYGSSKFPITSRASLVEVSFRSDAIDREPDLKASEL